jgi:hypothetical protein
MKQKLPDFNVFVFSLPRYMVYTSEDKDNRKKMRKQHKKRLGEYVPNEHFYEITENQFANWMKVMETPYAGCKVIIPVQGMRWEAVMHQPSKVIMMMRDPEEIRQSQEAFYSKKTDIAYLRTAIVTEQLKLEKVKEDNPDTFDFIQVQYQDVLADPKKEIKKIAEFIEAPNRITRAVNSVNKKANRFKREDLIEGI